MLKLNKIKCYCVGTGRTGTKSFSQVFKKKWRAAHEPSSKILIEWILKYELGSISKTELMGKLKKRDKLLNLEIESDGTLAPLIPLLLEVNPRAKFVLTVRDCKSWLGSVLDHTLTNKPTGFWLDYDNYIYSKYEKDSFPIEEHILKRNGLRPVSHYLRHWTDHIEWVLSNTDANSTLVLRTDQMSENTEEIARFLGIPKHASDLVKAHVNTNSRRAHIIDMLDKDYLEEKMRTHCSKWMSILFQENYLT